MSEPAGEDKPSTAVFWAWLGAVQTTRWGRMLIAAAVVGQAARD